MPCKMLLDWLLLDTARPTSATSACTNTSTAGHQAVNNICDTLLTEVYKMSWHVPEVARCPCLQCTPTQQLGKLTSQCLHEDVGDLAALLVRQLQ